MTRLSEVLLRRGLTIHSRV